jgi:hypothetical protein
LYFVDYTGCHNNNNNKKKKRARRERCEMNKGKEKRMKLK